MAKTCSYCDGDKEVDKNGNPPSSGHACGELFPCPKCVRIKNKRRARITTLDIRNASETIQNNLLTLLDGLPQEAQTRACQFVVDGLQPLKAKVS